MHVLALNIPWWIANGHRNSQSPATKGTNQNPTISGLMYFLYASEDQRPICCIFASGTVPDIAKSVVLPIRRLCVLMFRCLYWECLGIAFMACDMNFRLTAVPDSWMNIGKVATRGCYIAVAFKQSDWTDCVLLLFTYCQYWDVTFRMFIWFEVYF